MKIIELWRNVALLLASLLAFGGVFADALPYDYTAAIDCLADPLKPQYNGGIIINPEINDGLNGWTIHGGVEAKLETSKSGNKFVVARNRKNTYGSVSQNVFLEKDKLYTFSAWIQVGGDKNTTIRAIFKTREGFKPAGSAVAYSGCWSMLKGGITVTSSSQAELYFHSDDTSIDIWVDSISLQPFTLEEWRSHQDQSIEKVRKSKVRIQVLDGRGRSLPHVNISINQNKASFPFGTSINQNIINNTVYQNWFTQRFTHTTFENEMKWYSTENTQGKEDYSMADAMLGFTSQHGIFVRGHNIFWDDPKYQPSWVPNLSPNDLSAATDKRLNSIVTRYAGKVIAWDVNNENLHFNFFESKLGQNITNAFFQKTRELDGHVTLFINDYNTIEDERDTLSSPSKYIQKIQEIRGTLGANSIIGIGLESHFSTPNIPYIRSSLDTLAATKLPIWITELDVQGGANQVSYFEQILRELHSHPAIQGIVIWGPWAPNGQCYRMCLVDPSFKNLPPGDIVDKLLGEWGQGHAFIGTTDHNGFYDASLFHGTYEVKFLQEVDALDERYPSLSFKVDDHSSKQTMQIMIPHHSS